MLLDIKNDPFENLNISEIKAYRKKVKQLIDSKNEDLKNMVGKRYHDLIDTADIIKGLSDRSHRVIEVISALNKKLDSFLHESKLLIENNHIKDKDWKSKSLQEYSFSSLYIIKLQIETLLKCYNNSITSINFNGFGLDHQTVLLIFSTYLYKFLVYNKEKDNNLSISNLFYFMKHNVDATSNHLNEACKQQILLHDSYIKHITASLFGQSILNKFLNNHSYDVIKCFFHNRKYLISTLIFTKFEDHKYKDVPDIVDRLFKILVMTVIQAYVIFGTNASSYYESGDKELTFEGRVQNLPTLLNNASSMIEIGPENRLWMEFVNYFTNQYPEKGTNITNIFDKKHLHQAINDWIASVTIDLDSDKDGLLPMLREVTHFSTLGDVAISMYQNAILSFPDHQLADHVFWKEGLWVEVHNYFSLEKSNALCTPDLWRAFGKGKVLLALHEKLGKNLERDTQSFLLDLRNAFETNPRDGPDATGNRLALNVNVHGTFCKNMKNWSGPSNSNASTFSQKINARLEKISEDFECGFIEFFHSCYASGNMNAASPVFSCKELEIDLPQNLANLHRNVLEQKLIQGVMEIFRENIASFEKEAENGGSIFEENHGKSLVISNLLQVLQAIPHCSSLIACSDYNYVKMVLERSVTQKNPRPAEGKPRRVLSSKTTFYESLVQSLNQLYLAWSEIESSSLTAKYLMPTLSGYTTMRCLKHIPEDWEKVKISLPTAGQKDEIYDEVPVTDYITTVVPSVSSSSVNAFLFQTCTSLFTHFGLTCYNWLLVIFKKTLLDQVIDAFTVTLDALELEYDKVVAPNSALQLLYDFKTLYTILIVEGDHDKQTDSYKVIERGRKLLNRFERLIDPFEFRSCSPLFNASLQRHLHNISSVYGILLDAEQRATLAKPGATSTLLKDRGVDEASGLHPNKLSDPYHPIPYLLFYKSSK